MTPTDFMAVVDGMELVGDHYELTAADAMTTLSGLVADSKAEAAEQEPQYPAPGSP